MRAGIVLLDANDTYTVPHGAISELRSEVAEDIEQSDHLPHLVAGCRDSLGLSECQLPDYDSIEQNTHKEPSEGFAVTVSSLVDNSLCSAEL